MKHSHGSRRKMLLLSLFIVSINAAPTFPNSTTSSPISSSNSHMTTASAPVTTGSSSSSSSSNFTTDGWITAPIMPPPCMADGQICDREGQPTYMYYSSPYVNLYYTPGIQDWTPAYSSLNNYCEGVFDSSLSAWLQTAPITYGSLIPQQTIMDIESGAVWTLSTETAWDFSTTTYTTSEVWGIYSGYVGPIAGTTTGISVDFAGVEVTYTETLALDIMTLTETSFQRSWSVYTTSTIAGETNVEYTQAAYSPAGFASDFTFVPAMPCCKECTLFGGNVQVYYWPTATQSPPVSTLVNAAEFTFVSPSVYVAFQSLYATDFCGTVGGDVYKATTLAFNENDLSTAPAWFWNTALYNTSQPFLPPLYAPATWQEDKSCTDITKSFYQRMAAETGPDYAYYYGIETYDTIPTDWPTASTSFYHYTVTQNPCSPTLSVPTELFAINTLWTTCFQGIAGFFDPPYALSTGNGLVAFAATTTADPVANSQVTTTNDLVAGPTIAPVTPTPTKTTVKIDPTRSANNDPPAQMSSSEDPPDIVTSSDPADPAPNSKPPAKSPSPSSNDPPAQVPSSDPSAQQPSADASTPSSSTAANDPLATGPQLTSPSGGDPPAQSSNPQDPPPAIVTIGSSTITANSASEFVIDSQTLAPGDQITESGTVLSFDPSGSAIITEGTMTQVLAHPASTSAGVLIGSQTLSPGGPAATISGTTYSLQSDGSSVVIDGSTQPLSAILATPEYVVGAQTLVPGGSAITISGTVVSLQSGGSSVVFGGKTEDLSVLLGPSMTEVGLGGIIATIGGFETPTTTNAATSSYLQVQGSGYNGTLFLGGAERSRREIPGCVLGIALGIGVLQVWWL